MSACTTCSPAIVLRGVDFETICHICGQSLEVSDEVFEQLPVVWELDNRGELNGTRVRMGTACCEGDCCSGEDR